jgi:hypothetical protein
MRPIFACVALLFLTHPALASDKGHPVKRDYKADVTQANGHRVERDWRGLVTEMNGNPVKRDYRGLVIEMSSTRSGAIGAASSSR